MPIVNLNPVMEYAKEKGVAIGAFNCSCFESTKAIIDAAEELQIPVILNWAEVHTPFISMEDAILIMRPMAERASVPVCLHLDHGTSVESVKKALSLGFTSVMIDRSMDDYETNLSITKEVCEIAHSYGATVEAELGSVGAASGASEGYNAASTYTDPDKANDFVTRTGVDALAIAFGTAHGVYETKPVLDLDRVALIRSKIPTPLVMHGGSGLTVEEYKAAIKNGINKINYYTYMAVAGANAIKERVKEAGDSSLQIQELCVIATNAMKEDVLQAMRIFST